jgi:hypothetical protein
MWLDSFLIKCLPTKFYAEQANGWMARMLVIGALQRGKHALKTGILVLVSPFS